MRDSWHERVFSERWYFSDLSEWWCESGWSSVIGDECRFITSFACAFPTQLPDDPQKYEDNCNCPNSSASDSCSIRVGRRGCRGKTLGGRSRREGALGGRRGAGGGSGAV